MKSARLRIWILILLFTLLASVPFLVPHAAFVGLVAFVPLFALADLLEKEGVRHSNWLTYIPFLLFNIATTFWIWWISPAGAVAAIALNALQMFFIFWLFRKFRKRFSGALPYIFFIAAWIAWERVYQNVEISWPWLILGESFATSPRLVQWYEYTGFLGGSLWILLTSTAVYHLIRSARGEYTRRIRAALAFSVALLLIVPPVLSSVIYNRVEEKGEAVEVVAIQPNIDAYYEKHGGLDQNVQDSIMVALAEPLMSDDTRYVITPETFTFSFDLDHPKDNVTYLHVQEFLKRHPNADFLLGSVTYRLFKSRAMGSPAARPLGNMWFDSYNTAMMIDTTGILNMYHKSKLVPGTEIIPYERYIPFLDKIMEAFGGASGSYARQDRLSILHGRDGLGVGAMICYESVYGDYYRQTAKLGAGFVAVITNDGWWGDTPGYRQHFRYAQLRAIETRRDVVHVANTGITGFIDQRGDVVQRTGWWEPVAIKGDVHINDKMTFYVTNGDIIGRISCFVFLLLFAAWIVRLLVKPRKKKA
ncbi:MAG: apolipoprotein N-acyltransferase [Bacteroidales bacterium]|nr:apolipoprotein N-acyltransferase [Bacteroidales bacterium]